MDAVMLGSPFAPLDFKRFHRHAAASYHIAQPVHNLSVHKDTPLENQDGPSKCPKSHDLASVDHTGTQCESTESKMTSVEVLSNFKTSTEDSRLLLEFSGHKRITSAREASHSFQGEHPYRRHPSASKTVTHLPKQKWTFRRAGTHHLTQPNLRLHDTAFPSPLKTRTRTIQPKYYIIARPSPAYTEAAPVISKTLRHRRNSDMLGQQESARRPSIVSGLLAHRFSATLQLHPPSSQHPPHSPPLSESGFSDHSLFSNHSSGSSATTMSIPTSSDDDYMHGHSSLKHIGLLSFQKPASTLNAGQAPPSKSYNVFVAPRLLKTNTCPVGPYSIPISKYNRRSLSISTNGDPASGPMRTTRLSRTLRSPEKNLQVPETPEPVSPPPYSKRPSLPSLVLPSRRSSAPAIAVKSDEAEVDNEHLSPMEEEDDDLDFCCRGSDSPLPARLAFSTTSVEIPSELSLRRGKSLQALNLN